MCLAESSGSRSLTGVMRCWPGLQSSWRGRICHQPHSCVVGRIQFLVGSWAKESQFFTGCWAEATLVSLPRGSFHKEAHSVSASFHESEQARRVRGRERGRERSMTIFYIFILEVTSYPVTLFLSLETSC